MPFEGKIFGKKQRKRTTETQPPALRIRKTSNHAYPLNLLPFPECICHQTMSTQPNSYANSISLTTVDLHSGFCLSRFAVSPASISINLMLNFFLLISLIASFLSSLFLYDNRTRIKMPPPAVQHGYIYPYKLRRRRRVQGPRM